jgi:hypothetical protein
MASWDKRRPAEVLDYHRRLERNLFRIDHIAERKTDQQEALSQLRKSKRQFVKPVRTNGARARI